MPNGAKASARSEESRCRMIAIDGFDHCILLVQDLDDAYARLQQLGFRPTPRGLHSTHLGTANTTVVLPDRRTYFEALGIVAPTPANEGQRARLKRGEGLYGLAFKGDARRAAALFTARGLADGEVIAFSRLVELGGGTKEAAFTMARTRPGATPGAWLFVCQHHTPEVVWREDYQEQPNGARAVREIVGVADDQGAIESVWGPVFGDRLTRTEAGVLISTDTARITFLTPRAFGERFGGEPMTPAGLPGLTSLGFAVGEVAATRHFLERSGVPFTTTAAGSLLVPASQGCGAAFEFASAPH